MKKRILSILLMVCMVLTMCPIFASATDGANLSIGYSEDGSVDTHASLPYTTTSDGAEGNGWSWNKNTKTLTLSGLNLDTEGKFPRGISIYCDDVTIHLEKGTTNRITTHGGTPLSFAGGDATIEGEGRLEIKNTSGTDCISTWHHTLSEYSDITIKGGTVTMNGDVACESFNMRGGYFQANGSITQSNNISLTAGTLDVSSMSGNVSMTGGNLFAENIYGKSNVSITGGAVKTGGIQVLDGNVLLKNCSAEFEKQDYMGTPVLAISAKRTEIDNASVTIEYLLTNETFNNETHEAYRGIDATDYTSTSKTAQFITLKNVTGGRVAVANYYSEYEQSHVHYERVLSSDSGKSLKLVPKNAITPTTPTTPAEPTVSGFADVKESAWYADAVKWAVENDITLGTSSTAFSPNLNCSRGQIVTFLWRANGSPEPASSINPFKDVKASDYYYKAVLWAVEKGITSGTTETAFSPNANCTRAQTVTFLYRAAGSPELTNGTSFNDVSSDSYYADAVQWAVDNSITEGTGNGKFSPASTCTRAQVVTFLYRDMK